MIYFQEIFASLPCLVLVSITFECFENDSETLDLHPAGARRGSVQI